MVWIYDHPNFTRRELQAYRSIRTKLKNKEFVDNLIKLISLYAYVRRSKFSSVEEIQKSAYYDKEKTRPIFDEKTATRLFRSIKQKGGDSKYPYTDVLVKGLLRDYTPSLIGDPVGGIYGALTGTVDTLKDNIPFSNLILEILHSVVELGVTSANDLGEVAAGPVGAAAVAPFTAVAAGLASIVSTAEGDIGGAVAHIANWVPALGIILNKALVQTERMAKVLKDHESLAEHIPYMSEYHKSLVNQQLAGKRFSTRKHHILKWMKTERKKFATS